MYQLVCKGAYMTDPITLAMSFAMHYTELARFHFSMSEGDLRFMLIALGTLILCASLLRAFPRSSQQKSALLATDRAALRAVRRRRMPSEMN